MVAEPIDLMDILSKATSVQREIRYSLKGVSIVSQAIERVSQIVSKVIERVSRAIDRRRQAAYK